jgi:hypothetical protein
MPAKANFHTFSECLMLLDVFSSIREFVIRAGGRLSSFHVSLGGPQFDFSCAAKIRPCPRINEFKAARLLDQSLQANWRWPRKVRARTVTVAFSDQQAELFRCASDRATTRMPWRDRQTIQLLTFHVHLEKRHPVDFLTFYVSL